VAAAQSRLPTLAYSGEAEWFVDAAREAARGVRCPFGTVPGDHDAAFENADADVTLARPLLLEH
jgi:hypothetical protein